MSSFPTGAFINAQRLVEDSFKPGRESIYNINFLQDQFSQYSASQPNMTPISSMLPQDFMDEMSNATLPSFDEMTERKRTDMGVLEYGRKLKTDLGRKPTFADQAKGFVELMGFVKDKVAANLDDAKKEYHDVSPETDTFGRKVIDYGVMGNARVFFATGMQPIVDYFYDPFVAEKEMEELAYKRAADRMKMPPIIQQDAKRLGAWHNIEKMNPFFLEAVRGGIVGEEGPAGAVMGMSVNQPGVPRRDFEGDGWNEDELKKAVTMLTEKDFTWFLDSPFSLDGEMPAESSDIYKQFSSFLKSTNSDEAIEEVVQAIINFNYSQPGYDGPMENWSDALAEVFPEIMTNAFVKFSVEPGVEAVKEMVEVANDLRKMVAGMFKQTIAMPEFEPPLYSVGKEMAKTAEESLMKKEALKETRMIDTSELGMVIAADRLNDLISITPSSVDAKQNYEEEYLINQEIAGLLVGVSSVITAEQANKEMDTGVVEGLDRLQELNIIEDASDIEGSLNKINGMIDELLGEDGVLDTMESNLAAMNDPTLIFQNLVTRAMQREVSEDLGTFKDVQTLVNTVLNDPDKFNRSQRIKILRSYGNAVDTFGEVFKMQRDQNNTDTAMEEILRNYRISRQEKNMAKDEGKTLWLLFDPSTSWLNADPAQVTGFVQGMYDEVVGRVRQVYGQMKPGENLSPEEISSFLYMEGGNRISLDLKSATPAQKAALNLTLLNLYANQPTNGSVPGVVQQAASNLKEGIKFLDNPDFIAPEQAAGRQNALTSIASLNMLYETHGKNRDVLQKFLGVTDDQYDSLQIFTRLIDDPEYAYFNNPGMAWAAGTEEERIAALEGLRSTLGSFALGMSAVFEGEDLPLGREMDAFYAERGGSSILSIPLRGEGDDYEPDEVIESLTKAGIVFPPDEQLSATLESLLTINGELRGRLIANTEEETKRIIEDEPREGILRLLKLGSMDGKTLRDMRTFTATVARGPAGTQIPVSQLIKSTEIVQRNNLPMYVEDGVVYLGADNVTPSLMSEAQDHVTPNVKMDQALGDAYRSQPDVISQDLAEETLFFSNPNNRKLKSLASGLGISEDNWDGRVKKVMKELRSQDKSELTAKGFPIDVVDYTLSAIRMLFEEQLAAGAIDEDVDIHGFSLTALQNPDGASAGNFHMYKDTLTVSMPSSVDLTLSSLDMGSKRAIAKVQWKLSDDAVGRPIVEFPFILDYRVVNQIELSPQAKAGIPQYGAGGSPV